jgi:hypothetical protein
MAGMGTAFAGLFVASLDGVLLIPVPLVVGLAVCGVGKLSDYYESRCAPAIVGAYLGALSVVPLAVLGMSLDHKSTADVEGLGGLLVGALVGWVVVQPLAATAAARLFSPPKTRFRTALPAAFPATRLVRAPGEVTVSLLSLSF